jgi:hypothetical protein
VPFKDAIRRLRAESSELSQDRQYRKGPIAQTDRKPSHKSPPQLTVRRGTAMLQDLICHTSTLAIRSLMKMFEPNE